MPDFLPGRELAAAFYREVVAPLLGGCPHAAALLGEGSDVLGFDTARSTDHSWGPRLQLFVAPDAIEPLKALLERQLPTRFRGWPVRYYRWQTERVEHHVAVTTLQQWFAQHFHFDPWPAMSHAAWLATSQQLLLEATSGAVFHDDSGELTARRAALRWYPDDVWRWLLACQWHALQEQESFVGRTAEVGDDLGSRLITAQLAREIIRLCFLQERRYAPYAKWLGSAFARLACAAEIGPALHAAVTAVDATARESALARVYEAVASRQNALGIAPHVAPTTSPFEVGINDAIRPFRVLNARRFAQSCREAIGDERLRRLPLVGSIDQLTSASDELINFSDWPTRLSALYQADLDREGTGG